MYTFFFSQFGFYDNKENIVEMKKQKVKYMVVWFYFHMAFRLINILSRQVETTTKTPTYFIHFLFYTIVIDISIAKRQVDYLVQRGKFRESYLTKRTFKFIFVSLFKMIWIIEVHIVILACQNVSYSDKNYVMTDIMYVIRIFHFYIRHLNE